MHSRSSLPHPIVPNGNPSALFQAGYRRGPRSFVTPRYWRNLNRGLGGVQPLGVNSAAASSVL
jgi:hypothetical protein